MCLSINSIRLMSLTRRKSDIEGRISIIAMRKMALAREQSNLTRQYNSMLRNKDIVYYANGQYNQMTYGYLMGGYECNKMLDKLYNSPKTLKSDNSMILTDSSGLVIMGNQYVCALKKVLGSSCMNSKGRGGTFSAEKIPELIAAMSEIAGMETFSTEEVKSVMNGGAIESSYKSKKINTLTGDVTGKTTTDNTNTVTEMCQKLIDFYYPIFQAAAANGWTTEYNNDMQYNTNYISDALTSGIFCLAEVDSEGGYEPNVTLSSEIMSEKVLEDSSTSYREKCAAWYTQEKERISEIESWENLEQQDLSTELEATKTEMEQLQSALEDSMKPFEWCT